MCGIMHRSRNSSFDHLVGEREHLVRHIEAKGLRGLEIDHQREFRRPLDRKVGWLRATQDPIHISSGTAEEVMEVHAVADETSDIDELWVAYTAGNRRCAANSTIKCRLAPFTTLAPTTRASGCSR